MTSLSPSFTQCPRKAHRRSAWAIVCPREQCPWDALGARRWPLMARVRRALAHPGRRRMRRTTSSRRQSDGFSRTDLIRLPTCQAMKGVPDKPGTTAVRPEARGGAPAVVKSRVTYSRGCERRSAGAFDWALAGPYQGLLRCCQRRSQLRVLDCRISKRALIRLHVTRTLARGPGTSRSLLITTATDVLVLAVTRLSPLPASTACETSS
jgi:hypothetical protein